MHCPFCHREMTHIDDVSIAYRAENISSYQPEDGRLVGVTLDAKRGELRSGKKPQENYSRRRHYVELHIDCESCDGGSIIFAQNKGATEIYLEQKASGKSIRRELNQ